MDCVLQGKNLPGTLSLSNSEIPTGRLSIGIIYPAGLSIVVIRGLFVTFGAENFIKKTSSAADRRNTESANGRTPDIDCDNAWKFGRVDDFTPLSQADE